MWCNANQYIVFQSIKWLIKQYHLVVSMEQYLHLLLNRWMNDQVCSNTCVFTAHVFFTTGCLAKYLFFTLQTEISFASKGLSNSGLWCSAASGTHDNKTLTWMVEHCDVTVCMCEESSNQCGTMAFQCLQLWRPLFIHVHNLLLFSP